MNTLKLTITEAGIIAALKDGPACPIALLGAGSFATVNKSIGQLKERGLIEEEILGDKVYLKLSDDSQNPEDTVK